MFVALMLTLAAPPQFEVVNKFPQTFVVVNKIPSVTEVKTVAPEVAPARAVTFRNGDFDPDHQCDRCGRSQFRISGWLPNGRHRHTCASCGLSWVH